MTIETELPPASEIREQFKLPAEYNGWIRHQGGEDDVTVFEYWGKRSTCATGEGYTKLYARRVPASDEIRVGWSKYGQFGHRDYGHRKSSADRVSYQVDQLDRVWNAATDHMDDYSGGGDFETPPELPVTIGEWELICEKYDRPDDVTIWEWGFGEAELVVEETDMTLYNSYTRYHHQIRYKEPDTDPVVIVDDAPRRITFEIATHILRNLSLPLSHLGSQLDELQAIKGIGPAKSRQLALLGFTATSDVTEYVTTESGVENHRHAEEVDKILTAQIRESVTNCEGQTESETLQVVA